MQKIITNYQEILDSAGQKVTIGGFVHSVRDHGGLIFIDLRSQTELVQCVISPENKEVFDMAQGIRNEFVLKVVGQIVKRDSSLINPNITTGQIEIVVENIELVASSKTLPFDIHATDDKIAGEEIRLKYRYLDLRREKLKNTMIQKHKFILGIRNWFDSKGFIDIQTPILANSTPEGARDFLIPSRLYPGKFYALPQAPQQFKQLLMVGGFDKYYQIAPCFRDEDPRSDRHPGDFYQIDSEIAFADEEYIYDLCWKFVNECVVNFAGDKTLNPEFTRLEYNNGMEWFGSDKPDLRVENGESENEQDKINKIDQSINKNNKQEELVLDLIIIDNYGNILTEKRVGDEKRRVSGLTYFSDIDFDNLSLHSLINTYTKEDFGINVTIIKALKTLSFVEENQEKYIYRFLVKSENNQKLKSENDYRWTKYNIPISEIDDSYNDKFIEYRIIHSTANLQNGCSWKDWITKNLGWHDVKHIFKDSKFEAFAKLCESPNSRLKALIIKDATDKFSRSDLDKIQDIARSFGLPGMAYIQIENQTDTEVKGLNMKSPIFKFFGDETEQEQKKTEIIQYLNLEANDLVLFVGSDNKELVYKVQNAVRIHIAKKLSLINENELKFVWISDFPFFEASEEDTKTKTLATTVQGESQNMETEKTTQKVDFGHNPFSFFTPFEGMTEIQTLETAIKENRLLEITARQYDIVCNGYEVLSGGIRNNQPEVLSKAFEIVGYTKEEINSKFGHMMDAYRYGAPLHGGFAWGLDRLFMIMTGEDNIREVIAFPKNGAGMDTMTASPSEVREKDLKALNIATIKKSK